MKLKTIITALLLAFVALSVVVFIAKETMGGRDHASIEADIIDPHLQAQEVPPNIDTQQDTERAHVASNNEKRYIISYLHGRARCGPCRTLQSFATEAVNTHFVDEIEKGTVEFRVVNVAEPQNSHLAQRYEIFTQSVIVSEHQNGRELRWKNLDQIWQLVRDRDAYFNYIKDEVEGFIGKQ